MTDEISGKPPVPVGELEELVEEWRQYNDGYAGEGMDLYANCADELEALIERYDYE